MFLTFKIYLLFQVDTLNHNNIFDFSFTPISLTDLVIIIVAVLALLYSVKSFKRIDRIEKPILFDEQFFNPKTYIIEILDSSSANNLRILEVKCRLQKRIFYKQVKYEYEYLKTEPPLVRINIMDDGISKSYKFRIKTNYGLIKFKRD
jgi:hypothetical protein